MSLRGIGGTALRKRARSIHRLLPAMGLVDIASAVAQPRRPRERQRLCANPACAKPLPQVTTANRRTCSGACRQAWKRSLRKLLRKTADITSIAPVRPRPRQSPRDLRVTCEDCREEFRTWQPAMTRCKRCRRTKA